MTQYPNQSPPMPGQTPPGGEPPGQTPPLTQPPGQTPPLTQPPGQTPPGQQSLTDHWTDEDRNYFKRLRNENEDARKKVKALEEAIQAIERAKQEAEEAKQREQGQFKELAQSYETRVKELEPIATSYAALAALVSSQIETQVKDWPTELKVFDPGKDAPIEARLAWVEKSRPLVEKLKVQTQGQQPGNPPAPRPAGQANPQEGVAELQRRYQEMRGNPF